MRLIKNIAMVNTVWQKAVLLETLAFKICSNCRVVLIYAFIDGGAPVTLLDDISAKRGARKKWTYLLPVNEMRRFNINCVTMEIAGLNFEPKIIINVRAIRNTHIPIQSSTLSLRKIYPETKELKDLS